MIVRCQIVTEESGGFYPKSLAFSSYIVYNPEKGCLRQTGVKGWIDHGK